VEGTNLPPSIGLPTWLRPPYATTSGLWLYKSSSGLRFDRFSSFSPTCLDKTLAIQTSTRRSWVPIRDLLFTSLTRDDLIIQPSTTSVEDSTSKPHLERVLSSSLRAVRDILSWGHLVSRLHPHSWILADAFQKRVIKPIGLSLIPRHDLELL
jgi:hypothetical protein